MFYPWNCYLPTWLAHRENYRLGWRHRKRFGNFKLWNLIALIVFDHKASTYYVTSLVDKTSQQYLLGNFFFLFFKQQVYTILLGRTILILIGSESSSCEYPRIIAHQKLLKDRIQASSFIHQFLSGIGNVVVNQRVLLSTKRHLIPGCWCWIPLKLWNYSACAVWLPRCYY